MRCAAVFDLWKRLQDETFRWIHADAPALVSLPAANVAQILFTLTSGGASLADGGADGQKTGC